MRKLSQYLLIFSLTFTLFGCKKDNQNIKIKDKPGTINIEETPEEDEKVVITNDNISKFTENDIEYRNVSVVSLKTLFPIPNAFDVIDTSDPFNVRFSSTSKEFENIQIGALVMRNHVANPIAGEGFFENAKRKLAASIKFPVTAGYTLTLPSIEVMTTTFKTSKLYSNQDVYVLYETGDFDLGSAYIEYEEIPEGLAGTFLRRKHFYGERNYGTLPVASESNNSITGKVYCNFLFRVQGFTEYVYYVLAPTTKQELADSITKTLISHAKQDTPVTGNVNVSLEYQDTKYARVRVPNNWNKDLKINATVYTNGDFNSSTFGTSVFITQIPSDINNFERHAKIVDFVYDVPELSIEENRYHTITFVPESADGDITFSLVDEESLYLIEETEPPLKCTYRKIKSANGVDTIVGIFYKEYMENNALKIYNSIINSTSD